MNAVTRRHFLVLVGAVGGYRLDSCAASEGIEVPPQPYFASTSRALEAMAKLGAPAAASDIHSIDQLARRADSSAVEETERILDRYTLAEISIQLDGSLQAKPAAAERTLLEHGWRVFLLRVVNWARATDRIFVFDADLQSKFSRVFSRSTGASRAGVSDTVNQAPKIARNWLRLEVFEASPMRPTLSGLPVEYMVVQLYSRDRGTRAANLTFAMRAPGASRSIDVSFHCLASRDVVLRVRDVDGLACVASLTIRDKLDRTYPLQAMRLAPDMQFHPHIYRADGETVRLPDGEYTIESKRGPEYLCDVQRVMVGEGCGPVEVQLRRWVDPSKWGWYSGDTHIHAAGCAHYEHPTEGVSPETMIRHVRGEGLSIGNVLSWGPGWYYQKQFFSGHAQSPVAILEHSELQVANNTSLQPRTTPKDPQSLLRYDVEVSGFPSSHCGHLVLLGLRDQDYPGTRIIQDWPSWTVPILQWARGQGAIVGYAHCGNGMIVESHELPNYCIPPMDSNGAQAAVVDVTHGLVDFLAGCNTPPIAELNSWYHMLNCGFRLAFIGESDYPCFTDERPGVGRTYVRLDRRPLDDAGYDAWIQGLRRGRLYCGDGRSHFLDFTVDSRRSGDEDLQINTPKTVSVGALIAALLEPTPLSNIPPQHRYPNGWHIENCRIGSTRNVLVELVVNGIAVDSAVLLADGTPRSVAFRAHLHRSSWIALRILPSSHTHPVFVMLGDQPIRASRRSANWCRTCIDKLWAVKSPFMRESERPAAAEAFDYARQRYESIARECEVD